MPSFDIVSKLNIQEIDNAVNSVLRQLSNRYDFKGAVFTIEFKNKDNLILISADSDYKINALRDSLKVFVTKRGIDVRVLDFQKEEKAGGNLIKQEIKLRNGIDQESAKKIIKFIKDSKIKVQSSIKSDEIKVDGKKRDDLQSIMSLIKSNNFNIPLQFINFRE